MPGRPRRMGGFRRSNGGIKLVKVIKSDAACGQMQEEYRIIIIVHCIRYGKGGQIGFIYGMEKRAAAQKWTQSKVHALRTIPRRCAGRCHRGHCGPFCRQQPLLPRPSEDSPGHRPGLKTYRFGGPGRAIRMCCHAPIIVRPLSTAGYVCPPETCPGDDRAHLSRIPRLPSAA